MTPADSSYHLYLQRSMKLFTFGMLGLFTLIALLAIVGTFGAPSGGIPRLIGVLWLAGAGVVWYSVLSMPNRIDVFESGQVTFVSVLRNRKTTFREIRSIKPDAQFGFLVVQTPGGKIRLLNQFDGFHDFIVRLKTANPTVHLRGC